MEVFFKNTFPPNGKIKLAVAGLSENRRKKWSPLARKSVSTIPLAGITCLFKVSLI